MDFVEFPRLILVGNCLREAGAGGSIPTPTLTESSNKYRHAEPRFNRSHSPPDPPPSYDVATWRMAWCCAPFRRGIFFDIIFHTIDHYLCTSLSTNRDRLRCVLVQKKNQYFLNGLAVDLFVLAP